MHRPQLITWTTHTEESTTLLEATRLQEALLYTALHYTYMCNLVTEFYLYSIVYIDLINSRLDVTTSVRHHFRTTRTLSILSVMTIAISIFLIHMYKYMNSLVTRFQIHTTNDDHFSIQVYKGDRMKYDSQT